jgi:DNA-binding LacI/PurR family transcriptional regulator
LSNKSNGKTNKGNVHSNILMAMNKIERHQQIIQLIDQSDGKNKLGTRELAEQFGVSEMTVRRDLHELSQEGLLRRQHGGASSLRQPRNHIRKEIGILLVSTTGKYSDPFFNAVLEGADGKLQELGYRIAYINTRAEVSTAAQARDLLQSNPVSGIILVGPPVGAESIEYLKANVSALIQTTGSIGPDLDNITFDGYYGIRQMVNHLLKRGYRRLGFITGLYDARQQAFMDGVKANDLPSDDDLCVVVPFGLDGWTPELGHIGAQRLMGLPQPPEAIVCASDRIAIGAIQWLHQHNIRVPQDIAVTGFDNISESAFTVPSLTTVHVHKQLMGELAAERAVKRIENEHEIPLLIQTPTHLVIRQSCGSQK